VRLLRRWWHRLRGWWVLAATAAAAAVLSAMAQVYASMTAAAVFAVGLAVVGVVSDRARAQVANRPPSAGLLVSRVDKLTDPLRLGVHRAAALDGDQVPPFVPRDLFPHLTEALRKGGFVLVVGDSTAGKTRLAYEAVRASLPRHVCVVPTGPDTLRAVLDAAKAHRPSILWLDDLDRYLGIGGLTRTDVDSLNTLVLATLRTQERDRLSHRHDATRDQLDRRLARAGRELLDAVTTEIHLDRMWSGHELAAAAHTADPRIARAVVAADRHGIAEQLAAGPELARELRDAWDTHTRAAALVTAAIDLRRAGCHRPAPLEVLRTLHESYVKPGTRPEPWADALAWATQPLHATSSLLEPVADGYLAFDYLLDRTDPIPDEVWQAIVEFASPIELLEVAPEATFHGKHGFLRAALAKSLAHKEFMVASALAGHLADVGFDSEAAELLGDIAAQAAGTVPAADLLRIRRTQVWWLGEAVREGRGAPDRAFTLARDLVQDTADLLGATTTAAYESRLVLIRNTPDPVEALRAVRALLADVTAQLGPDHELTLSVRFEEALCAGRAEGPRAAVRLYYNLLDYADTQAQVHPSLYVDSQWTLGTSLLAAGETQSAVEVLEVAVENAVLFFGADNGTTFEVRLSHVMALDGAGRLDEALTEADQLAQDAERVLGPDHPTTSDARFAVDQLTARKA
jgi:eukaryotic-like serine/threonine-protein kinase